MLVDMVGDDDGVNVPIIDPMVLTKLPLLLLLVDTESASSPSVKSRANIEPLPRPFTVIICELATMVPSVFSNLTINRLVIV